MCQLKGGKMLLGYSNDREGGLHFIQHGLLLHTNHYLKLKTISLANTGTIRLTVTQ